MRGSILSERFLARRLAHQLCGARAAGGRKGISLRSFALRCCARARSTPSLTLSPSGQAKTPAIDCAVPCRGLGESDGNQKMLKRWPAAGISNCLMHQRCMHKGERKTENGRDDDR